jgi:transcriptional regulator with XRE-family HTH domain
MRISATTLCVSDYNLKPIARNSTVGAIVIALMSTNQTSAALPVARVVDRTVSVLDAPAPSQKSESANSSSSAAATILSVKSSSGLTWEALADVLNVSRRTLHLWANGAPVNQANQQNLRRLEGILGVLKGAGVPKDLLWSGIDGRPLVDLLRDGRFDEALANAKAIRASAKRKSLDEEPRFLAQFDGFNDRPIADSPYAGRSRKKHRIK